MSDAPSGPSTADLEALAGYAAVLADGIERAIGPWVERSVEIVCEKSGVMVTGNLRQQARTAGAEATAEIAPRVHALLALDIDEQRLGPPRAAPQRGSLAHKGLAGFGRQGGCSRRVSESHVP